MRPSPSRSGRFVARCHVNHDMKRPTVHVRPASTTKAARTERERSRRHGRRAFVIGVEEASGSRMEVT
jgi:hypothetical protein